MIDFTPPSIAFHIGPIPVYFYGIAYALGLAAAYVVLVKQARRFHEDPEIIANGIIVIAVAALIGGRAYHVIDQWNLYKDDPIRIFLPPYSGLGVYGGLITGIIAFLFLVRHYRVDAWVWADIVAPALFVMQAVGRWGNFFNQELFGPPTNLPWGIAIDCAHRLTDHGAIQYPCDQFPLATTHFQPLFLYESISGAIGAAVLIWLSIHARNRLRRGDLILIFFIWYPIVRFLLESLRNGNWKVGGIPTAQIFSILFALGSFLLLLYRHRNSGSSDEAREGDPFDDEVDEVDEGGPEVGVPDALPPDASGVEASRISRPPAEGSA